MKKITGILLICLVFASAFLFAQDDIQRIMNIGRYCETVQDFVSRHTSASKRLILADQGGVRVFVENNLSGLMDSRGKGQGFLHGLSLLRAEFGAEFLKQFFLCHFCRKGDQRCR